MPDVQPFPFDELPQCTQAEVALKKKLFGAYHFFTNRPDFVTLIAQPLVEVLQGSVRLKITHVESKTFEEMGASFSDRSLVGVMRLEPQGKKVGLIFDSLLAKILIHKILTKQPLTTDKLAQLHIKPLTALEEAVVQYFLVVLIDQITNNINDKNFALSFEDVLRTRDEFRGQFSNQEDYALFSIKLNYLEKDFYLKLVLPLSVSQDLANVEREEEFVNQRIRQFENMKTEFQLEVGYVTLEPSELDSLAAGDIVLFDEMLIEKDQQKISGYAEMKQTGAESLEGYRVAIETQGDIVKAKIDSML
ncbi:MAG: hypothetical protein ACD_62C00494G0006 [uncultured bacterium]|nr:MAG: hypothetical protein ACD_62C00494G0006 [uncultured bacterium]